MQRSIRGGRTGRRQPSAAPAQTFWRWPSLVTSLAALALVLAIMLLLWPRAP